MKWFSILALSALALCSNACEKHAVTELPAEDREGTPHADKESLHAEHAEHAAPEGGRHEDAPPNAAAHEEKVGDAHAEKTQGEVPKFFPEQK